MGRHSYSSSRIKDQGSLDSMADLGLDAGEPAQQPWALDC
jgi:hypothetical protein